MDNDAATIRAVVAEVARELDAQIQPLTSQLATVFLEEIPAFRGDDSVKELMAASTSANLSTIFDVLLHGLALDAIELPAAAAAYARRFAQRDLPIEGLLRAYRMGQTRLTQWCVCTLGAKQLSSSVLLGATQEIIEVVGAYIDRVSEHLVELYETERKLWGQRTNAARVVALRTVLQDEQLDIGTAEAMIGYRLRGWHLAAVAWVVRGAPDAARQLESVAGLLGTLQDGGRPLALLDDERTLWLWLSGVAPPRLEEWALAKALETEAPTLRIALGEPAAGLAGFRASHEEARRARAVTETSGEDPPLVTSYTTVGLTALLAQNVDALRTWVGRTLGELARDDPASARMRETVRIFLETGGSFTDAAARLHLHKNTVHYRVRKAEEVRGRPLRENRVDVEVALMACHHLGPRVLDPPE
ncbi:MAG TPA: helix-turn-helix domain-containing protein [Pseudonocardia sp.]|jgi:hypothetical protein|uniref:PucR family transcriptional regulator n=1 Tax=Pseudonocardia sp. TaxID=60912 RepID=UPI002F3E2380